MRISIDTYIFPHVVVSAYNQIGTSAQPDLGKGQLYVQAHH